MIGIVLWSDPTVAKAVFLCEDQGDLAYFRSSDPTNDAASALTAGDMVCFDVWTDENMRRASNPKLISGYGSSDLPNQLRATAGQMKTGRTRAGSAKILPFEAERTAKLKEPAAMEA
jgi:cold shock CspA family protein